MSWSDDLKDLQKDKPTEYPPGAEPWNKQSPAPWETGSAQTATIRRVGISSVLVGLLSIFIFVMGFVLFGQIFRGSEVFQTAMEAARSDARVTQALGEPVNAGWFITGEISTSGLAGSADLRIPIYGPNGRGTLFAGARRENGVWNYYTLAVTLEGRDVVIDLR